ncbi:MAG TPA: type III PLP-dependent enzyme [Steroidobacteraceae bacterium]|nr:type III PLP-dependent enzyme [Steroidobacteraceae bacterium]
MARAVARATKLKSVPVADPAGLPAIDPFTPAQIERLAREFGSPLLIIDCERVRRQYRALQEALPGVDLHYALKPLPHPAVVATLRDEGAWFDLATTGEIDVVRTEGVSPERCIHTHPIKRDSDIRDALAYGVNTFVVDNPDEIAKFSRYRRRVRVLVRISFRSPDAVCDLSRKFGCDPADALALLERAQRLDVPVAGFSFHVGSQAVDSAKHVEAVNACIELIATARARKLADIDLLDIGGGFPVDYVEQVQPINEFCAPIRAALARLPEGIRVIAEPGRFICGPAAIGVATVMGRAKRDGLWWYYLDDGLYGSFSGQLYDHSRYPVSALRKGGPAHASVLAGPTCDSIDVIAENVMLPELKIGDLIVGRAMGAYTWASATDFNFFPRARVVSVNQFPGDRGSVLKAR